MLAVPPWKAGSVLTSKNRGEGACRDKGHRGLLSKRGISMCPGRDGEGRRNAGQEDGLRRCQVRLRWICWVSGPSDGLQKRQLLMKPHYGSLKTVSLDVAKFWSPPRSTQDLTMLPKFTLAPMLHPESSGETQALPRGTPTQLCLRLVGTR